MNAKLKVDLRQGSIEVEGTQEFASQIYADFKEKLRQHLRMAGLTCYQLQPAKTAK